MMDLRYRSEVEDYASCDPQTILILRAEAEFIESRQQVVHLQRAKREAMGHFDVHAAADGHGKRIVGGRKAEAIMAADVRVSEKHLTEWSHSFKVAVGYPRGEKINRKRAGDSRSKNIIWLGFANFGPPPEPITGVVRN